MEFKKLTLEDYARSSKEVSGYASIPTYGPLTAIHRCNNTEAEYLFRNYVEYTVWINMMN
mgnify:CR=1 FL=1